MIDFNKELQKQLKHLQNKYKVGFNVKLIWQPMELILRPRISRPDGKRLVVNGQWKQNKIFIYEGENLERAIHILNHEFVEKMLLESLVDPYVIFANTLQNVFRTLAYKAQEEQIEILAKLEDEEYKKEMEK